MSFPTEVILARVDNGTTKRLFITSIGGRRIAVVNPSNGNITARIPVPEGGSGLVYHPRTETLIMANRFDNSLHLINPSSGATGDVVPIGRSGWDPTPPAILEGRQFLYTGSHSANGNVACATCHPYGHMDGLGWDLGDPSGDLEPVDDPVAGHGIHSYQQFRVSGGRRGGLAKACRESTKRRVIRRDAGQPDR